MHENVNYFGDNLPIVCMYLSNRSNYNRRHIVIDRNESNPVLKEANSLFCR